MIQSVSHYRILELLGSGGMGEVYLAEDERLPGRRVAVKLLRAGIHDEEAVQRFLGEATAASSLEHPGISEIHEVDRTEDGRPFLVMAHYGGGSLHDRLREAPLDPELACRIAIEVASALEHAHARGIVHRDIKPGNLMFTSEGFLKIVDFGLARFLDRTRITVSGAQLGTVSYMSPEQAAGEDVDERTDIWSLGVVLYEMLTGDVPFRGANPQVQIFSIRNDRCPPIRKRHPDVPDACAHIVARCLEKERHRRYRNMGELIEDLVALSRSRGWSSHLPHRGRDSGSGRAPGERSRSLVLPGRGRPWPRRTRRPALAALLAVVVAAAAGGYAWHALRSRAPSAEAPYVTDLRVAVLPFTDRVGATSPGVSRGLTEVVADVLGQIARARGGMWVSPMRHVRFADPPDPSRARRALGVNRVITGELQPFRIGHRLTLRLHDPDRRLPLAVRTLDYMPSEPRSLSTELPARLVDLLGSSPQDVEAPTGLLPAEVAAIVPYLSGRGVLKEDPGAAVQSLERCLSADPDFPLGRVWLARARIEMFDATGDSTELERAWDALGPPDTSGAAPAELFAARGDVLYEYGRVDSAVSWYKRAVDENPHDSWSANMAGRALRTAGRYDEATDLLRTVIAVEPDNFANHRDLGSHYYRAGRNAEAVSQIDRALALAPDDAWSINLLGAIHLAEGNWSDAGAAFERSLSLVPDCDACSNVGLMYFYQGDYESAAEYYKYALALCDTTKHTTWANLASSLYWIEGQRDRAVELYNKAIDTALEEGEIPSGDVFTISHLVDYYAMCGRDTEARDLLGRLPPGVREDPDALYRLGCALEMLGDRASALEYISDAIRHGTPVAIVRGTPELEDLVADVRFAKLTWSPGEGD